LPGFEAVPEYDPGAGVAARIPDIGINRDYDF